MMKRMKKHQLVHSSRNMAGVATKLRKETSTLCTTRATALTLKVLATRYTSRNTILSRCTPWHGGYSYKT